MSAVSFLKVLDESLVYGFIDNDKAKIGKYFFGKKTYSIDYIKDRFNENLFIYIASERYHEISAQLEILGYLNEVHFKTEKQFYLEKIDSFLISFMKSGRTWLRYILGSYVTKEDNTISILDVTDGVFIPFLKTRIKAYHDDSPHLKNCLDLSATKEEYYDKSVVYLVRHPLDVLVSLFYHFRFRSKQYEGDINKFCLEQIDSLIAYNNIWARQLVNIDHHIIIRYEDLKNKPYATMQSLFSFFNIQISFDEISTLIDETSIDKMKAYELNNNERNPQLSSKFYDKNINARKVRKGQVGSYKNELDNQTLDFLERKIDLELNDIYGY